MTLLPAVLDEMKRRKADDIMLFGGGIIPDDDKMALEKMGVAKIFTPGAPTEEAIQFLKKAIEGREAKSK
jgi:methylmalonyl-CoA mutase C-terminal domain/subunit